MKLSGNAIETIRSNVLNGPSDIPDEIKRDAAKVIVSTLIDAIPPFGKRDCIIPIMAIAAPNGKIYQLGSITLRLDDESGYWNAVKEEKDAKTDANLDSP